MEAETRETNIRRLNELLQGQRVAMLTTLRPGDGSLRSRPMIVQELSFDGTLNFLTRFSVEKVEEIGAGSQVNVAFANPEQGRFISISGAAYILRDRIRIESMWDEIYRPWFPQGLEDPEMALLRVDALEAEFWDAAGGPEGESLLFA